MNDLFNLKGKTAIVTGGRIGIGRAIVDNFIEQGVKVIVVGKTFQSDLPIDIDFDYIQCDLSDKDDRKKLKETILNSYDDIDILINNAGNQEKNSFLEYTIDQWNNQIELLLTSVFDISQHIALMMAQNNIPGRIINIGSISSFQGARNIVGYITAKHGLIGLTKSMAIELAEKNINVNCIAPGCIETDLLNKYPFDKKLMCERIPQKEIGTPDDIIGTVLYLCSSASNYVTGVTIPVDGGWLAK